MIAPFLGSVDALPAGATGRRYIVAIYHDERTVGQFSALVKDWRDHFPGFQGTVEVNAENAAKAKSAAIRFLKTRCGCDENDESCNECDWWKSIRDERRCR